VYCLYLGKVNHSTIGQLPYLGGISVARHFNEMALRLFKILLVSNYWLLFCHLFWLICRFYSMFVYHWWVQSSLLAQLDQTYW